MVQVLEVELAMNLRKDWSFTITEKAPTMASPQLKVPLAFSYALNVKAIVGDFNQEEILVMAFSVIVEH